MILDNYMELPLFSLLLLYSLTLTPYFLLFLQVNNPNSDVPPLSVLQA